MAVNNNKNYVPGIILKIEQEYSYAWSDNNVVYKMGHLIAATSNSVIW